MTATPFLIRTAVIGLWVGTLGMTTGCRSRSTDTASRDPLWWSLEAERVNHESELNLARYRWSELEAVHRAGEAAAQRLQCASDQKAHLEQRRIQLAEEVAELKASNERWLQARLSEIRHSHEGISLPTLQSNAGKTYHDVTIQQVSKAGVEFRHATGLARLTARQLTQDQLESFGIDPVQSYAVVRQETLAHARYVSRVESAEILHQQEQRKQEHQRELAIAEAARDRALRFSRELAQIDSQPRSALSEAPRRLGRDRTAARVYGTPIYRNAYGSYSCSAAAQGRQPYGLGAARILSLRNGRVYPDTINGRALAGPFVSVHYGRPAYRPPTCIYPYRR
ncbi:hypothetical protein HNR46_003098 [Haloferula luteola]|uniref:Uncharacterized protein n=1 Tax=Haloferula luteola TaxID=595692 RepID=A0A840VG95_9BACT|nr:hypothetical protein [Haloferula luteola]MBB5352850.1 hypothetical protein [Haloferula luteola]